MSVAFWLEEEVGLLGGLLKQTANLEAVGISKARPGRGAAALVPRVRVSNIRDTGSRAPSKWFACLGLVWLWPWCARPGRRGMAGDGLADREAHLSCLFSLPGPGNTNSRMWMSQWTARDILLETVHGLLV